MQQKMSQKKDKYYSRLEDERKEEVAQFAQKAAAATPNEMSRSYREEFSIDVNVDNIEVLLNQQRTSYDLSSFAVQIDSNAADNVQRVFENSKQIMLNHIRYSDINYPKFRKSSRFLNMD